jgi:hypothetical protein
MAAKRVTRPKLERDRPRREWSTLFGAAPKTKSASPGRSAPGTPARPADGAVSDTVELGYRVIEDYVKQGQQAAQAFASQNWAGAGGAAGAPGSTGEMQQMAQRVMQYGWDFAGLWFEMWTRMGGPSGMPPMPGSHPHSHAAAGPAGVEATANGSSAPAEDSATSEVLSVSVESALPTTTSIELRPGRHGELVIHALRPEGQDGPPIKGVTLERSAEDGSLVVNVVVDAGQKPGTYRAAIVAAATNKAVGTLSVRVQAKKR